MQRMKRTLFLFGLLLFVSGGIAISYFALDQEINWVTPMAKVTDPDFKKSADLAIGSTHYEFAGPGNAPLVILIHGVSGPMIVWDRTVPTLQKAGFRTLRFDLYGRGFSDRPRVTYDLDLYVNQLTNLLEALAVHEPFHLIGHSMGAIIATEFTARFPARVRKLALIGPAGFPLKATPLAKLIQLPGVGEYLMAVAGDANLRAHNRKYFYRPEGFADFEARFARQLRMRGSKRAILSTYRSVPLQNYREGYRRIGQTGREVLVVWGTEDVSFPYEHHKTLMEAVPGARLVSVPETAHLPQFERPDLVNPALLDYLR